jgi:hypothetical protein
MEAEEMIQNEIQMCIAAFLRKHGAKEKGQNLRRKAYAHPFSTTRLLKGAPKCN